MAITTNDEKLAIIEYGDVWEPAIPLDETSGFDQGDKQQMLWDYPGILWGGAPPTGLPNNRGMLVNVGKLMNP